jgi:cell division protein FtsQ
MKKFFIIFAIFVIAACLAFSFFLKEENSNATNEGIIVEVEQLKSGNYISAQEVEKLLKNKALYSEKMKVSDIDRNKIYSLLEKQPYVRDASCFFDKSGKKLVVKVYQREPFFLVNNLYCVDKDGERMDTKAGFKADVPLVTGYFSTDFAKGDLYDFIKCLQKENPVEIGKIIVVNTQDIVQRDINGDTVKNENNNAKIKQNGFVELIPRNADYKIIVGYLHDRNDNEIFTAKINRLKKFYDKKVLETMNTQYSAIDLRVKGQAIGVRK